MFKNYLKVALRNLQRHKVFTIINLAGLVIGMTCSMLILFWVQDELSTDRFHKNVNNIHRIVSNLNVQPAPLAPTLIKDYPEVKHAVSI